LLRTIAVFATASLLCLAPVAGAQEGVDPQSDWSFIQKLLSDGMPDVAARQYLRFAQSHPTHARAPEALFNAGEIFERLEQSAAALDAYESLLRAHPNSAAAAPALLRKGQILTALKRDAEATQVYRGLLTSYPGFARLDEARLGLGEALMAQAKDDEAARNFRFLLGGRAAAPIAARALFDLGILDARADRDSLALVHFDGISERHPKEILGAFGLMRAAALLNQRGEAVEAARRFERVLASYDEPLLVAQAHLGLADMAEARGDHKKASTHYRRVAEGEAPAELLQAALLGLARSELEAGRAGQASTAAQAYAERFPEGKRALQARLLARRADLASGDPGAVDSLRVFAAKSDAAGAREIAHEAWTIAAMALAETAAPEEALRAWRQAARSAPSADRLAESLLAEAQLAADGMGQHALAHELAREAAASAEDTGLQARCLFVALQQARFAALPAAARAAAEGIVRDHSTTPEAAIAQLELRRLELQSRHDPEAAARKLAELAAEPAKSEAERALEIGRILRDLLGDSELALRSFEAAAAAAGGPAQVAAAHLERGRSHESAAFDAGLDGELDLAAKRVRGATAAYAEAASVAGGGDASRAALLGLLRLELAIAATNGQPWEFDAAGDPLRGGIGVAESADPAAASFDRIRARLHQAYAQETALGRGWCAWRLAELDASMPLEARFELLQEARRLDASLDRPVRFALSLLYRLTGQDQEAAGQLRRLVEGKEADALAWAARYELAELHRAAKNYVPAAQLYAEIAGALPRTQKAQRSLLLAGDCSLYAGKPDEAAERYELLLARHPHSVYRDDALYRLATTRMRTRQYALARQQLEALIAWENATDYRGRALLKLAELEGRAGRSAQRRAALEELNRSEPEFAREQHADLDLAELLVDEAAADEALRQLERSEDATGASARLLEIRVRALAQKREFDRAQRTLETLERGFPAAAAHSIRAALNLAEAEAGAGRSEAALRRFETVRGAATDSSDLCRAAFGAGLALSRLERMEDARSAFDASVRADPESDWAAQSLFKLGQYHLHEHEDDSAQRAFARLTREHKDHPLAADALRAEAQAWRNLGAFDKAVESYHRLLEEHPDLEQGEKVLAQIAYCHHEMGAYETAIASYRRVLSYLEEEDQAYAQFWIADSYEQLGRFEEAAAEFLRVPYQYPGFGQLAVTAQLKAGGVYEKNGSFEAAERIYRKVLSAHGASSTWGVEAQKRLDRMTDGQSPGSR
jgi:TolA-binding protein